VVWWITNHSKASHADRTLKLFVKDEGKWKRSTTELWHSQWSSDVLSPQHSCQICIPLQHRHSFHCNRVVASKDMWGFHTYIFSIRCEVSKSNMLSFFVTSFLGFNLVLLWHLG
jgi:hypothetical protein